jgi:hypothetical protein
MQSTANAASNACARPKELGDGLSAIAGRQLSSGVGQLSSGVGETALQQGRAADGLPAWSDETAFPHFWRDSLVAGAEAQPSGDMATSK